MMDPQLNGSEGDIDASDVANYCAEAYSACKMFIWRIW